MTGIKHGITISREQLVEDLTKEIHQLDAQYRNTRDTLEQLRIRATTEALVILLRLLSKNT